ncbi:MAG: helix-turn-helix transcriptional regulator [Actinocatenispora sp.]
MTTVETVHGAESTRRFFADELRRLRHERGLTQEQLAQRISYSTGTVSMIEKLQRNPTPGFTEKCDEVLETGGALTRLLPLLSREAYPSWFRPFVKLEAEAVAIQEFEVQVIAGLLQTEDYARAVLNTWPPKKTDEIEHRLAARMERQQVLTRDDPPLLSYVLDESVLRRPMGGAAVMAGQLQHLIDVAQLPHIQLQILTFDRATNAPTDGSFFVLELPRGDRVVYVEGPAGGRLIPDRTAVQEFARAFDAARCQALAVEDSIALIARVRGELYGDS